MIDLDVDSPTWSSRIVVRRWTGPRSCVAHVLHLASSSGQNNNSQKGITKQEHAACLWMPESRRKSNVHVRVDPHVKRVNDLLIDDPISHLRSLFASGAGVLPQAKGAEAPKPEEAARKLLDDVCMWTDREVHQWSHHDVVRIVSTLMRGRPTIQIGELQRAVHMLIHGGDDTFHGVDRPHQPQQDEDQLEGGSQTNKKKKTKDVLTHEQALDYCRHAFKSVRSLCEPIGARISRSGYPIVHGPNPFWMKPRADSRLTTGDGGLRFGVYDVTVDSEADTLEDALGDPRGIGKERDAAKERALCSSTNLNKNVMDDVTIEKDEEQQGVYVINVAAMRDVMAHFEIHADKDAALMNGFIAKLFPTRMLKLAGGSAWEVTSQPPPYWARILADTDHQAHAIYKTQIGKTVQSDCNVVHVKFRMSAAQQQGSGGAGLMSSTGTTAGSGPAAGVEMLYELFAQFRATYQCPFVRMFDGTRAEFKIHRGSLYSTESDGGIPVSLMQRWSLTPTLILSPSLAAARASVKVYTRVPLALLEKHSATASASASTASDMKKSTRSVIKSSSSSSSQKTSRLSSGVATLDANALNVSMYAPATLQHDGQKLNVTVNRSFSQHMSCKVHHVCATAKTINKSLIRPLQSIVSSMDVGLHLDVISPSAWLTAPGTSIVHDPQVGKLTCLLQVRGGLRMPTISELLAVLERMTPFFCVAGASRSGAKGFAMYRRASGYSKVDRIPFVTGLMRGRPQEDVERELRDGFGLSKEAATTAYYTYVRDVEDGQLIPRFDIALRYDNVPAITLSSIAQLGFDISIQNVTRVVQAQRISALIKLAVIMASVEFSPPAKGPAGSASGKFLLWVEEARDRHDRNLGDRSGVSLAALKLATRVSGQATNDGAPSMSAAEKDDVDLNALVEGQIPSTSNHPTTAEMMIDELGDNDVNMSASSNPNGPDATEDVGGEMDDDELLMYADMAAEDDAVDDMMGFSKMQYGRKKLEKEDKKRLGEGGERDDEEGAAGALFRGANDDDFMIADSPGSTSSSKTSNKNKGASAQASYAPGANDEDDDNMPKAYMLKQLSRADPALFRFQGSQYSTDCGHAQNRQPVVISPEELQRINSEFPESHSGAVAYGSTPELAARNLYLCPKIWCPKSRISLSDEMFKKLGNKCPYPHVQEDPIIYDGYFAEGRYVGFLQPGKHPKGLCLPCCFRRPASRFGQCKVSIYKDREQEQQATTTTTTKSRGSKGDEGDSDRRRDGWRYIRGADVTPLEPTRYGMLPEAVARILLAPGTDAFNPSGNKNVQKRCGARPDGTGQVSLATSCFVRLGISQSTDQGFLNCAVAILQNPTIKNPQELIATIRDRLTPDVYVTLNEGRLCRAYMRSIDPNRVDAQALHRWLQMPQHQEYVQRYNLRHVVQELGHAATGKKLSAYALREAAIRLSMQAYLDELSNPRYIKTHLSLQDLLSRPLPWLNPHRVNLVLFERTDDEDADGMEDETAVVSISCPAGDTGPSASLRLSDPIALVIRQGHIYEPIVYLHMQRRGPIIKMHTHYENDDRLRRVIDEFLKSCGAPTGTNSPMMKDPLVGSVPMSARLLRALELMDVPIKAQVIDFSLRLAGFVTTDDLFVPLPPPVLYEHSASPYAPLSSKQNDDSKVTTEHLAALANGAPEAPLVGSVLEKVPMCVHLSDLHATVHPRKAVATVQAAKQFFKRLADQVGDDRFEVVEATGPFVVLRHGGAVPLSGSGGGRYDAEDVDAGYLRDLNVFIGKSVEDQRVRLLQRLNDEEAALSNLRNAIITAVRRDVQTSNDLYTLRSRFYPLSSQYKRAHLSKLLRALVPQFGSASKVHQSIVLDTLLYHQNPLSLRTTMAIDSRGAELVSDADIASGWIDRAVQQRISVFELPGARKPPVTLPASAASVFTDPASSLATATTTTTMTKTTTASTSATRRSRQGIRATQKWLDVIRRATLKSTSAAPPPTHTKSSQATAPASPASKEDMLELRRYMNSARHAPMVEIIADVNIVPLFQLISRITRTDSPITRTDALNIVKAKIVSDQTAAEIVRASNGATHPTLQDLINKGAPIATLAQAVTDTNDRYYEGGVYDVIALAPFCDVDVLIIEPFSPALSALSKGSNAMSMMSRRKMESSDSRSSSRLASSSSKKIVSLHPHMIGNTPQTRHTIVLRINKPVAASFHLSQTSSSNNIMKKKKNKKHNDVIARNLADPPVIDVLAYVDTAAGERMLLHPGTAHEAWERLDKSLTRATIMLSMTSSSSPARRRG